MKHRHLPVLDSSSRSVGRREALGALVAGAAAAYVGCSSTPPTWTGNPGDDAGTSDDSGSSSSTCDSPPAGVDVGDASNFAVGTWSAAGSRKDPYIVGQDANGFFAYSAICTHQGCQIGSPDSSGKTTCPCHGAQFDGNGAVLRSPARSPLPHYAVALCGGHLYVDSATTVSASTRTPAS